MTSSSKRFALSTIVAVLMCTTTAAFAQTPASTDPKHEEGYSYAFSDDPLVAEGFLPSESRIQVRGGAVRVALIRPRITFVPQMLKSVENL